MPRPDRSNQLAHVVVLMFENRSFDNLLGRLYEALLAKIYNAIRTATSDSGSNVWNTLFLVTFDEHGGTYDHVPPPVVPAPRTGGAPGQLGFGFRRSGVRTPAIAVSPWIPAQTVATDHYRNTSVIATLRQRWQLGPPRGRVRAAVRQLTASPGPRRAELVGADG